MLTHHFDPDVIARRLDVSDKVYFADPSLSNSQIKLFNRSRQQFKAEVVDKTAKPAAANRRMSVGSAVHALWFKEPTPVVVYSEECFTKDGKKLLPVTNEARAAFEELHEESIILRADELKRAEGAVQALEKHEVYLELAEATDIESAIVWRNNFDRWCRCKPDFLTVRGDVVDVFDLKVTNNPHPDEFKKRIRQFGYWLQVAHYSEGVAALYGKPVNWKFVVVGDTPCATGVHQVQLTELDETSILVGAKKYHDLLVELEKCYQSGDWREVWEKGVNKQELKDWDYE